jgi:hypothetical protein
MLAAAILGLAASPPGTAQTTADDGAATMQRCLQRGWSRLEIDVDGMSRMLLWRGPPGAWARGAILVAHGGGGRASHWCAGAEWFAGAQIRFADAAVAEGFAVFALVAHEVASAASMSSIAVCSPPARRSSRLSMRSRWTGSTLFGSRRAMSSIRRASSRSRLR